MSVFDLEDWVQYNVSYLQNKNIHFFVSSDRILVFDETGDFYREIVVSKSKCWNCEKNKKDVGGNDEA